MANATFKSILRADGTMVAGLAAVVGGAARFFVVQRRESNELFIGRIAAWVKTQDAEKLEMQSPEMLPEGIEVGAVLMRVKHAMGIKAGEDAAEYEVKNVDLVWNEAIDPSN